MRFYAYESPGDRDENLIREDVFRDYKDCGFNTLMIADDNKYNGDGWDKSRTKRCFDLAKKVGIKEVVFDDWRIYDLSRYGDKLVGIGEEYKFQSLDELDAYVKECMSEYINEEVLLGIRLHDEPFYDLLECYGIVYKSVKRVAKELGRDNFYININMNPMITDIYAKLCPEKDKDMADAYEYYIDQVFKATGADRICVDNYPFRTNHLGGRFLDGYYKCFQILRKKCDEYGAKLAFVVQAFELYHKQYMWARAGYRRVVSLNQMMLQFNSALGFKVDEFSFYTYVTHRSWFESTWRTEDGSSFITPEGEKTCMYDFGKIAIEYAKNLAPTLEKCRFLGSNLKLHSDMEKHSYCYIGCGDNTKADGTKSKSEFDNSFRSNVVKNVEFNKDILLSTEFVNQEDGMSLCMFENVIDHIFQADIRPMKIKVDFGKKTKKAKIFNGKTFVETKLRKGICEYELSMGEALWIIPLK